MENYQPQNALLLALGHIIYIFFSLFLNFDLAKVTKNYVFGLGEKSNCVFFPLLYLLLKLI